MATTVTGSTRTFRFDGATSIPDADKYRAHHGQRCKIIARLNPPEVDREIIMYRARFKDGWVAQVWWDEIATRSERARLRREK